MAKSDTYIPSMEQKELVERFFNGDRSDSFLKALRDALASDKDFYSYFNRVSKARSGTKGRGDSWSVGTRGSRMSGDDGQVRWNKGSSAWNQYRMSRAGYGNSPTSPGGFKSSGRDEDSALRRGGEMTPDVIKSKVKIDFDRGTATFGGRKYSKAQLDAVLARGMSGATMNWKDQALYDSIIGYGSSMDEVKENRLEAMRKSAEDRTRMIEDSERERIRKERSDALADIRKRDLDLRYALDKEQGLEDIKKSSRDEQDAYEQRVTRERYGIPDGVELTKDMREKLNSGALKWGLSKDDEAKKRRLEDELSRIISDPNTDINDLENVYAQLDALKSRLIPRMVDKPYDERTIGELLNSTTVDEYGTRWGKDKDGNLVKLADPRDTLEDKELSAEEKRLDKIQERVDKYIDARTESLMKPRKGTVKDSLGNDRDGTIPGMGFDEAYEEAMRNARIRFPDYFGVDDNKGDVSSNKDGVTKVPTTGVERFDGDWKAGRPESNQDVIRCVTCGQPLTEDGYCENAECPESPLFNIEEEEGVDSFEEEGI